VTTVLSVCGLMPKISTVSPVLDPTLLDTAGGDRAAAVIEKTSRDHDSSSGRCVEVARGSGPGCAV